MFGRLERSSSNNDGIKTLPIIFRMSSNGSFHIVFLFALMSCLMMIVSYHFGEEEYHFFFVSSNSLQTNTHSESGSVGLTDLFMERIPDIVATKKGLLTWVQENYGAVTSYSNIRVANQFVVYLAGPSKYHLAACYRHIGINRREGLRGWENGTELDKIGEGWMGLSLLWKCGHNPFPTLTPSS